MKVTVVANHGTRGRDVVVDVNNYRIEEDDGDNGNGNGYRNKGGEDAADSLRINNVFMREYYIRRLGEIRANRYENKLREALDSLKRSASLSKDDDNDDNGINNSNNGKNGDGDVGGRRREDISTSWGDHPHNLLRLSVEAAAIP